MSESSSLKVSVWSAYSPSAALVMSTENGDSREGEVGIRELRSLGHGLHQEVFSWRMMEDAFGGITVDEDRLRLSSLLLDGLSVSKDPNSRGIIKLREFLADAQAVVADGKVEWSGSQSSINDDEERRLNPLLALINHLDWLANVFDEHPGISVTVR